MKRAMAIGVMAVAVAVAGCGGGKQSSTIPPAETGSDHADEVPDDNDPSKVIPTEALDQIQRAFARKGPAVSRCLAMVVESQELPRNSHGKITLQVKITTGGTAGAVKVLKSTLPSNQTLESCVVDHMKQIQFPQIPTSFPATYTYAIEAM